MIGKIRNWLEQNHIFFKIFTAVILSGMAVYVSWQANSIAEKQTQILRHGEIPFIRITVDLVYDQEHDKYTEDRLLIYNDGAPLYNLEINRAIYFEVNYAKSGEPLQSVLIPINDYYIGTTYLGNSIGELAIELNNVGNRIQFFEIDQSFQAFARENNAIGYVDIRRYIGLNYRDVFNEFHSEIYYIDEIYGSNRLSDLSKIDQIEDLYRNVYPINLVLELSEITPELLLAKLEDFSN